MKKLLLIILLFCGSVCSAQNQEPEHKLTVVAEDGESVPYLYIVSSDGAKYLSSNSLGEIVLDNFKADDTLTFHVSSSFYIAPKITFGKLKQLTEFHIFMKAQGLEELIVLPEKDIVDLLEMAANKFSSNYIRDYVAIVDAQRRVLSGNKYLQLYMLTGLYYSLNYAPAAPRLYFNDQMIAALIYPLDCVKSNFYAPQTGEIVTRSSVQNPELKGINAYKVNYSNDFDTRPLFIKRGLELYSPINKKHIKDYTYRVAKIDTEAGQKRYTILFTTKREAFPRRTKFYGTGKLVLTEDGTLQKICIENMEERYSYFIRHTEKERLSLITPYTLEVEYATASTGKIYASQINITTNWQKPENVKGGCYEIDSNPYRKPFENKINTATTFKFTDVRFINSTESQAIIANLGDGCKWFNPIAFWTIDSDNSYWERRLKVLPDYRKLSEDLHFDKMSLSEQSRDKTDPTILRKDVQERTIALIRLARNQYQALYGKGYNE